MQFRRVGRIALYTLYRGLVVAIDLRCVPPGRVGVPHGFRRACEVLAAIGGELLGRRVLRDEAFVDAVSRPAAEARRILFAAAHLHPLLRVVLALFHMGEPVVSHELNPKRGEHIEERRLLVIAFRFGIVAGQTMTGIAKLGFRLYAGEETAADDLRVRLEQTQTVAVPGADQIVSAEVGECRLELDVTGEQLTGRAHQRIANIVADPGQVSAANQIALADLLAFICDCRALRNRGAASED